MIEEAQVHTPNEALEISFTRLILKRTQATIEVLRTLGEIDARRIYLDLGYSSTFDYLRRKFNFSEGSTQRHIAASRLLRQFPAVEKYLKTRAINLSTLTLVARELTAENADSVCQEISGKSVKNVTAWLIARQAKVPGVRTVSQVQATKEKVSIVSLEVDFPRKEANSQSSILSLFGLAEEREGKEVNSKDVISSITEAEDSDRSVRTPTSESRAVDSLPSKVAYKFEFYADEQLQKMLQNAQILLSSTFPKGASIAEVLIYVLGEFLSKHKKRAILEKGEELEKGGEKEEPVKEISKAADIVDEKHFANQAPSPKTMGLKTKEELVPEHTDAKSRERSETIACPMKPTRHSRYIPQAVRNEVMRRDGGCCSYRGPDGTHCGSKWDLELDHIVPHSHGGTNSADNLRVVCRAHNMHHANSVFGEEFVQASVARNRHFGGRRRRHSDHIPKWPVTGTRGEL